MAQTIQVLIVDDNTRSRNGLKALLNTVRSLPSATSGADNCSKNQVEIEVAGEAVNGKEAVHRIAECQPDVVIMDARMPEMDGMEATRLIKARWPEIKIIVLTLYAAYREQAMAAGANIFLVKGCPNEMLLAAILNNEKTQSNPEF